jgi:hypothetical protein
MSIRLPLKSLAALSLLTASIANAATTGQVDLSGEVTSSLAMTATPTSEASALDLMTASEQIVKVADISATTNNDQGLTFTISSGSLAKLGGQPIAFKVMSVGDSGTAPLTGAFTVASGTDYQVGNSAAGDLLRDLYIKFTPAASQDPGVYTATIDLLVEDN